MPKIAVSKTAKAGVGKYETVDVQASIEFDIPDAKTSTVDAAFKHAFSVVDAQINNQLNEVQSILKPDSVFLMEAPKTKNTRR